ncbi:tryptase [Anopheles darlingi]|uniref:Tryptase n=1 Tax=Anopheles darlingi TaxID=43151 RepID=W5JV70_ANODA|nr:tryptase [Anopheles darlingi]
MAYSFCGVATTILLALVLAIVPTVEGQKLLAPSDDSPEAEHMIVPNEPKSLDDCHFRYYEFGKKSINKPTFGVPAYLREFAHMAAIGWTQPDKTVLWNCGGSLISERFVLTAAHCAQRQEPDVVRLGDINLFNDTDDQYAQQIRIAKFIANPSYSFLYEYHDIALLLLERKVVVHDTVAPACLWNDEEIRFTSLEATGWGAVGFVEGQTPTLLKVTLSPFEKDRCSNFIENNRRLPNGLDSNQMCAGDDKQDTCRGDSGGPLQVKLLHNTRVTPFIVAVTSFGRPCGQSVPGIYTRVAPYISWIQSTLKEWGEDEWLLQPQACARKYVELREYEPRVQLKKIGSQQQLDMTKAHLFSDSSRQLVEIHWESLRVNSSNECYGVIIDESTVLTLARCTMGINGMEPTHVTFVGNKTHIITHRYKHPNYEESSFRNDIGVLKVKEPFEFNADFTPACVWTKNTYLEPEMEVTGRGLLELNRLYTEAAPEIDRTSLTNTVDVLGIVMEQNGTNCSLPKQYTERLPSGLSQEHVCFGAEPFLVPSTCSQAFGGPLQREVFRYGRSLMYVNALNLFGRDCGFGESAVAVRPAHHRNWLESVLYPPKETEIVYKRQPVTFLHEGLEEGDNCTAPNGLPGVCVNYMYCPKVTHDGLRGREVKFCETGSLVCCPHRNIRYATNSDAEEIDSCERNQDTSSDEEEGSGETSSASLSHVVPIVWRNGREERVCIGTIVSSRIVLTAASCLHASKLPSEVELRIGMSTGRLQFIAGEVIVHPEFDNTSKKHNLALIKMKDTRNEEQLGQSRACLWRNSTHTPLMIDQLVLVDRTFKTKEAHLKFNTDCRRAFRRVLSASELCLKVDDLDEEPVLIDDGMPAFWSKRDGGYLVGIVSHRSSVSDRSIVRYTRLSSYIDWIKSEL